MLKNSTKEVILFRREERFYNMKALQLFDGVHRLSADIGPKDLFEGIWPIPSGVSLNSYTVKGDKVALIDLIKDWEGSADSVTSQMQSAGIELKDVDYLILNHLEPDHTGWLNDFCEINRKVQIFATKKGIDMVKPFYHGAVDNLHVITDGETLDLGKGKVLTFFETPNVHWPETMMTYESSSKTLFSCDAFGAFGKVGENAFDDQLTSEDMEAYEYEALRYYSNIVSTFSPFVQRAIAKLEGLEVSIIAPSHGIIWRKNPTHIIEMYQRFASYGNGQSAEKEITLIWSSMYGNTEQLLEPIMRAAKEEGVLLHVHQVPQEHSSFVLASAWRSAGIIVGTPTYEYKMFPPMFAVLDILDRSHVRGRRGFRFGSFGWSGGAQKQFDPFAESLKWECMDPIEFKGAPSEEDKQQAYNQTKELAQYIKGL